MAAVRYTERQNNTTDQVADYLGTALQLTAAADVPDDLRVAYFTKAADLLSGKQITAEVMQIGAGNGMALPGRGF